LKAAVTVLTVGRPMLFFVSSTPWQDIHAMKILEGKMKQKRRAKHC
jgi:hypothetical protein